MSKQAKRIYVVTFGGKTHLVKAATPAQAKSHVVKGHVVVEVAKPEELFKLGHDGFDIEIAGEEDE
jgi:hypothetical protein